jgi:hypothetical protein
MSIRRLFVIDWIPDLTLSPESLAVRSGLVKLPKKGIRFDCVCLDEDVIVGWNCLENSVPSPMWLCDGSSRIVPCGRTTFDCWISQLIETPEEEQARKRVDAIWEATNRHEFDLHQEFPISPRAVFLDRDEPGDTGTLIGDSESRLTSRTRNSSRHRTLSHSAHSCDKKGIL